MTIFIIGFIILLSGVFIAYEYRRLSVDKACGKQLPYVIEGRRPGDVASSYADASKAAKELGWKAQYGIDEMCSSLWNWQSKNPKGYKE